MPLTDRHGRSCGTAPRTDDEPMRSFLLWERGKGRSLCGLGLSSRAAALPALWSRPGLQDAGMPTIIRRKPIAAQWCRRRELNPRPTHYECVALPLSYCGFFFARLTRSWPAGREPERPVERLDSPSKIVGADTRRTSRTPRKLSLHYVPTGRQPPAAEPHCGPPAGRGMPERAGGHCFTPARSQARQSLVLMLSTGPLPRSTPPSRKLRKYKPQWSRTARGREGETGCRSGVDIAAVFSP